MVMPMISVIMATFNRAHLLPRAIESVLRQTYPDWELVVVDDGSQDATPDVLADFKSRDARIITLRQQNAGLSAARNMGIADACGEFVTFLDSDDEYRPGHLALRAKHMLEHPEVDMVHGGLKIVGGDDTVPDCTRPGERIRIADCHVGGTFFIRAELLGRLGGFHKPDFGNDHDLALRAQALGAHIDRVAWETYIYHRDEPDSMCNNIGTKTLEAQGRHDASIGA